MLVHLVKCNIFIPVSQRYAVFHPSLFFFSRSFFLSLINSSRESFSGFYRRLYNPLGDYILWRPSAVHSTVVSARRQLFPRELRRLVFFFYIFLVFFNRLEKCNSQETEYFSRQRRLFRCVYIYAPDHKADSVSRLKVKGSLSYRFFASSQRKLCCFFCERFVDRHAPY